VEEFDAELYLRLEGERMLLGARPGQWSSTQAGAARALVAIGAIGRDAAQEILDEYGLAQTLRLEGGYRFWPGRHRQASRRRVFEPRRVVPCDRTIETTTGTLRIRYVSLAASETELAVGYMPAVAPPPIRRGGSVTFFAGRPPNLPPAAAITDDHGTSTHAHFSGGGSGEEWIGTLTCDRPLAPDARWIEVDGVRIDLDGADSGIDVRVEPVPEDDPAWSYLWATAARHDVYHRHSGGLDGSIRALVAAGAVASGDPRLDELRAAADALLQRGMARPPGALSALPPAWRSLLARATASGRIGLKLTVGAATPVFDDMSCVVVALETYDAGFGVDAQFTVTPELHGAFEHGPLEQGIVWWAADDRGNHYLGELGSWSANDDRGQGTVGFWPGLDPAATRLDLMPTGPRHRAVIGVPLPPEAP
jgi:hypothetical protein